MDSAVTVVGAMPRIEKAQDADRAVQACLENIRRDLLRRVERGELSMMDGERYVEGVGELPCGCCRVSGGRFEIDPARQEQAVRLFSRLRARAAREGIAVTRFAAICGGTVCSIPAAVGDAPERWRLGVQYRVVID